MMVSLVVFSNTITVAMSSTEDDNDDDLFEWSDDGTYRGLAEGKEYEDLTIKEKEKYVKNFLDMGDTISEATSSVTEEDREKSEYLSDLYEEMLDQQLNDKLARIAKNIAETEDDDDPKYKDEEDKKKRQGEDYMSPEQIERIKDNPSQTGKDNKLCDDYGGEWDYGEAECMFHGDEESATAYEDALCDDPEDTEKYSRCRN